MRTPCFLVAALVLAACGSSDRRASSEPGASPRSSRGPDPIVLRVARGGGRVSAYAYPNLDSAVWRSSEAAPPLARVLAFDVEGGHLAALDTGGIPTRIDLRLGQIRPASDSALELAASADGVAIFGVANERVVRLTPSGGDWSIRPPAAAQQLWPQRDGTVLIAGSRGGQGVVWQVRPPSERPSDSAVVASGAGRPVNAPTGDRVYFVSGSELVGVHSRGLDAVAPLAFDGAVVAVGATPSGDRLYVAVDGVSGLTIVDRYTERVTGTVELPGATRELRVDPLGRFVLARAPSGDSAWVVAIGTDRLVGSITTAWRADLPLVLPDGAIAAASGDDVTLLDGESLGMRTVVPRGALDFWHVVLWNGFRPRAAGLDQPVRFRTTTPRDDSVAGEPPPAGAPVRPDTPRPPGDTVAPPAEALAAAAFDAPAAAEADFVRHAAEAGGEVTPAQRARPRGYTVQFAAAASEREARAALGRVRVDSVALRIVPARRGGRTVWRVVAGPFATRAVAERVGRASRREFWVYEGAP